MLKTDSATQACRFQPNTLLIIHRMKTHSASPTAAAAPSTAGLDPDNLNEPGAAALAAQGPAPVPRVTLSELTPVLERHRQLAGELAALVQQQAVNQAKLDELFLSCNLEDRPQLQVIAERRLVAEILPRRLELKDREVAVSAQLLAEAVHHFIGATLGPRVRAVRAQAGAAIRATLQAHLSEAWLLEQAVENSGPVREINAVYCTLNPVVTREDVLEYATRHIASWRQINQLAKKY